MLQINESLAFVAQMQRFDLYYRKKTYRSEIHVASVISTTSKNFISSLQNFLLGKGSIQVP